MWKRKRASRLNTRRISELKLRGGLCRAEPMLHDWLKHDIVVLTRPHHMIQLDYLSGIPKKTVGFLSLVGNVKLYH